MREFTKSELIERSLTKRFRKELWSKFIEAVQTYDLISENDRIAVCISGGKDSMLMALLFKKLQKITKVPFEVVYLAMNPGYNEANLSRIKANAEAIDIPLTIYDSDIFDVTEKVCAGNPCYLCARMRRGCLYSKAKELNCNKIALGHHLNDVIETTVMAMCYGSQLQCMLPKLHSTNFEGMELIRPLYCIKENDIILWAKYNNLEFIRCACRMSELSEKTCENTNTSKRQETKILINNLKKNNPNIENNIFKAVHNVCLDTFPEYKTKNKKINFLDNY